MSCREAGKGWCRLYGRPEEGWPRLYASHGKPGGGLEGPTEPEHGLRSSLITSPLSLLMEPAR